MNKAYFLLAAAAALTSAGCNGENTGNTSAPAAEVKPVAPPPGGDWTQTVTATPEGGYAMGNPEAAVKLVEFGSMTCPHCAAFDEEGVPELLEKYVKTGQVSFEFRNYVRDPFDLTASLIARCNGEKGFFPLTKALFADQRNWIGKLQGVTPEQQQALTTMGPSQQFLEVAKLAGFQQWAAMRGVPTAKSTACLTNEAEVNRLVEMNGAASSDFKIPGTPSFLINGELVQDAAGWAALEPKLREAIGS